MASTTFYHPNIGQLSLRFAPTQVEWAFNLVTSVTPTYAGEVVQVLAVNFDHLTVEGQLGREGPSGAVIQNGQIIDRPVNEQKDLGASGQYATGLTQMTEFFQRYFAIASQGGQTDAQQNYIQTPMTLHYDGVSDIGVQLGKDETWQIYPTSFPSYSRSLDNFAPKWQVECQVYEAPISIKAVTQKDVIAQLSGTDKSAFRPGIGYRPFNQFSDPFGVAVGQNTFQNLSPTQQAILFQKAENSSREEADDLYQAWRAMIPAYDDSTLKHLINIGGSLPTTLTNSDRITRAFKQLMGNK